MDTLSYVLGKKAGGSSPTPQKYAPRVPFQMYNMFKNYEGTDLTYEINNIDTTNCISFVSCFNKCENMTLLDLSSWKATNVEDMNNMFAGCKTLTELNMSSFYTPNLTNTANMFNQCTKLTKIDMRNFDFSNDVNFTQMFGSSSSNRVPYGCLIIVKDNTQKQWMNTNFSNYHNVVTPEELEG